MNVQDMVNYLKQKDQEFISYAASYEYSEKNCMALFSVIAKRLEKITKEFEPYFSRENENLIEIKLSEEMEEYRWLEEKKNYYDKLFSLGKNILNRVKMDFQKSSEILRFVLFIQLLAKFELKKLEIQEKLDANKVVSDEEFDTLRTNQEGINLLYQKLAQTRETISNDEFFQKAEEVKQEESAEQISIENENVNLLELIDDHVVEDVTVAASQAQVLGDYLQDEEKTLSTEFYDTQTFNVDIEQQPEAKENLPVLKTVTLLNEVSSEVAFERQIRCQNYLSALLNVLENCCKRKEKALQNPDNEMVDMTFLQENIELLSQEIARLRAMTPEDFKRKTDRELNLPFEYMDFDTAMECIRQGKSFQEYSNARKPSMTIIPEALEQSNISLEDNINVETVNPLQEEELLKQIRNFVASYERFTGHKMSLDLEGAELIQNHYEKSPQHSEATELSLLQQVRSSIKNYETQFGRKINIYIEEKKQKRMGKVFKVLRKAEEAMIEKFQKRRKLCYTSAIVFVASVLGISINNVVFAANKYEYISIEQEEKKNNMDLNIESGMKEETQQALELLEQNASFMEEDSMNYELPFHINQSVFTLLPGSTVFIDEYLGLDGQDTARNPLYPAETPRVPECFIMRNLETGEIIRLYSDEAALEYMKNCWEVIGTHSFDGFYSIKEMNVEMERGISR